MQHTAIVSVPATSANLGPGFDTLGLTLDLRDELTVSIADDGITKVTVSGVGAGALPTGASNLIVKSMKRVFAEVGKPMPAFELRCTNRIPHSSGLGSSAAAVVSGILAARELLIGDADVSLDRVYSIATEIEGHPDNAAPAIFGGLTIAWIEDGFPKYTKITPLPEIMPVAFVPDFSASTRAARRLMPARFPRTDVVFNLARVALLIEGLTHDPSVLLSATDDRIHQQYRASAMPRTIDLVADLRSAGIPAAVSGAGPSVIALCTSDEQRDLAVRIASAIPSTQWQPHMLAISAEGATVGNR